ncbi:ricin-type beta-trefoil lectin domain protein [Streptomyces sp. INA 01156]
MPRHRDVRERRALQGPAPEGLEPVDPPPVRADPPGSTRGEILGDIGRTTYSAGRNPAQCLHAGTGTPNAGAVDIRGCDGSAAQKWDMGHDGTIRPRDDRGSCLTALAPAVGLTRCEPGRRSQQWNREPWRSATWKRTAWRISGSADRCLYQDDRELPPTGMTTTGRAPS